MHPQQGTRIARHVAVHVKGIVRGQRRRYAQAHRILKKSVRIGLRALQNQFIDFQWSALFARFLCARQCAQRVAKNHQSVARQAAVLQPLQGRVQVLAHAGGAGRRSFRIAKSAVVVAHHAVPMVTAKVGHLPQRVPKRVHGVGVAVQIEDDGIGGNVCRVPHVQALEGGRRNVVGRICQGLQVHLVDVRRFHVVRVRRIARRKVIGLWGSA